MAMRIEDRTVGRVHIAASWNLESDGAGDSSRGLAAQTGATETGMVIVDPGGR